MPLFLPPKNTPRGGAGVHCVCSSKRTRELKFLSLLVRPLINSIHTGPRGGRIFAAHLMMMGLKRVLQACLGLLIAEFAMCFSPGATVLQGGRLRRPHRYCDSTPQSPTLLYGRSRPQSSGLILAMANGGGDRNNNRSVSREARQHKRLSARISHTHTHTHTHTYILHPKQSYPFWRLAQASRANHHPQITVRWPFLVLLSRSSASLASSLAIWPAGVRCCVRGSHDPFLFKLCLALLVD
jgi:hypothetical protein